MLCFKPLFLAVYSLSVNMNGAGEMTNLSSPGFEFQSCEREAGVYVRVLPFSGLYAAGIQWGVGFDLTENLRLTATPFGGVSYVDHPVRELPQRTQFDVGGKVILSYDRYHLGVEYHHQSNAGMTERNIGTDGIAILTGRSF